VTLQNETQPNISHRADLANVGIRGFWGKGGGVERNSPVPPYQSHQHVAIKREKMELPKHPRIQKFRETPTKMEIGGPDRARKGVGGCDRTIPGVMNSLMVGSAPKRPGDPMNSRPIRQGRGKPSCRCGWGSVVGGKGILNWLKEASLVLGREAARVTNCQGGELC